MLPLYLEKIIDLQQDNGEVNHVQLYRVHIVQNEYWTTTLAQRCTGYIVDANIQEYLGRYS